MYHSSCRLGASPDGLVTNPSEREPFGLVEIKCPARAERLSLFKLSTDKQYKSNFFLHNADGKYQLKNGHNYCYQIQGQLQITSRQWCDLIVLTPSATIEDLVV